MTLEQAIGRLGPKLAPFDPGHVWLAGAGPGNPGALTIEVVSALAHADAIVYDALVDASILNAAEGAELHFMGKRAGRDSARQDEIIAQLIALARRGKRVLRLKGGDPYVFGRGGEEALALAQSGIPYRILPGITSAFGAMASVGIPATTRGINKAIILATGHAAGTEDDLDWAALAATRQPIAVYMGFRNIGRIATALLAGGLEPATPVAIIMSATTAQEEVMESTLGAVASNPPRSDLSAPALIIIGDIVAMRARLIETANNVCRA